MTPLNCQEQQSSPMLNSTPTVIQEPEQQEYSSSQRTLVDNGFVEQGDHLSQPGLSEDDGERPPLLHVCPEAKLPIQQQGHSPKSKRKSILKEWWLEIALLIFSIWLFLAIVILLTQYDKQPMPSWSFHLNLNSMVAILSTLLRSSLFMILGQGLYNTTGHLRCSTDESNYSNKSTEVELAYSSSSSPAFTLLRSS